MSSAFRMDFVGWRDYVRQMFISFWAAGVKLWLSNTVAAKNQARCAKLVSFGVRRMRAGLNVKLFCGYRLDYQDFFDLPYADAVGMCDHLECLFLSILFLPAAGIWYSIYGLSRYCGTRSG